MCDGIPRDKRRIWVFFMYYYNIFIVFLPYIERSRKMAYTVDMPRPAFALPTSPFGYEGQGGATAGG
jgi:hypothetical protein